VPLALFRSSLVPSPEAAAGRASAQRHATKGGVHFMGGQPAESRESGKPLAKLPSMYLYVPGIQSHGRTFGLP
jgi:hypothetical protein